MARSSSMRSSHDFLFFMHICLSCDVFPVCVSVLHVLLFLHAHFPYTCYFSCMCVCLPCCVFPQNWVCAQQAPNTDIVTRAESLPNSSVYHYLCQCVIHFGDSLALHLSLASPFVHTFLELRGD
jgi:hypothetical protein